MRARVSSEWLSGCSGCHVAIVDLHEKLVGLAEDVEFVRIPVLMDEKGFPEAEVGIVEGAIRNEHDRKAAMRMRESVKTLVAFGSCAVYGGPSGLGWLHGVQSVLDTTYGTGPTNTPGQVPKGDIPALEEGVLPLDEVVDVDFYLPGCPPHPYYIAAGLRALLGGSAPPLEVRTVCTECDRKMLKRPGTTLKTGAVSAPDHDLCFLSQGVVCLGSVSLNRCQAPCPAAGIACTGCAGPSADLVREPHLDLRTMVAKRMSMLTDTPAEQIVTYIEGNAKTFYAYAVASPAVYRKPTMELREWAGEVAPPPASAAKEG